MPAQPITVSSALEERLKGRRAALDILRGLPEDYQLFYNPSLRGKAAVDHADPALDYILAHKDKGLLGIAVKSGEIVEEPGGFISQYQPQKQLYKIIDPVKPADPAAKALLSAFDPEAERIFPCGVAVLFPDTHRHEFSQPPGAYLFVDDLEAPDVAAKLDGLFLEPVDSGDLAKFRAHFSRLTEFLKGHSDNAAIFEERAANLKQAAEARKATPPVAKSNLRMKVAVAQGLAEPKEAEALPEPELQIVTPPTETAQPRPSLKARIEKARTEREAAAQVETPDDRVATALTLPQENNALALQKAQRAQATVVLPGAMAARKRSPLRAAPVEASRQKDMFTWLEEVQEKGEGDAMLSSTQWLMVIGIAVAIICAVYFMSRNLAIATAAG